MVNRILGLMIVFLLNAGGCNDTTTVSPAASLMTLTNVQPNVIAVGASDTGLQLTGTGFKQQSTAVWNGTQKLASTFVSSTSLRAIVPASNLTSAGSARVNVVLTQGTNQTATQSLTITIGNTLPTLTGISPQHGMTTDLSLTLTVTGTNFNSTSVVMWNTTALATTLVSSTQLTAIVPPAQYATAGVYKITVVNSGTGGGTTTASNFTVVAPLSITTTTLPSGSIGLPYSATLTATGGTLPYAWSVSTGALPAGLTLDAATGVISGTPSAAGSSTFTVTCTDATGTLARIHVAFPVENAGGQ